MKREAAGRYRTEDGRFRVEQSSAGWLIVDDEQIDDLGLPLVRGPVPTLGDARAAIDEARSGPAPTSQLAQRVRAHSLAHPPTESAGPTRSGRRRGAKATASGDPQSLPAPEPEPVVIRVFDPADGIALRALWSAVGFRSLGDDDASLAALADRNPGLLLVATQDQTIVASALGSWDGRRGWIYHVATAPSHRRRGIARDLVTRIETGLRGLGAPKVNVLVRDGDADALRFWESLGYDPAPAHQLGREL